jgi:hypothetical protein
MQEQRDQAVRRIALAVDPGRLRRVHAELAMRLAGTATVHFAAAAAPAPVPGTVDLLLDLERLVYRLRGPRLGDRIEPEAVGFGAPAAGEVADLVIELGGGTAAIPAARTLRLLYDGVADEAAALAALFAGRMPVIEVVEAEGGVLARGVPCADNAPTISDALECVLAAALKLTLAAAQGRGTLAPARPVAPAAAGARTMAAFELRGLAHRVVHSLYQLCFHTPHWRTCWRFVDGPDLWDARTVEGTAWNVIPDPGFRFYADPFPFEHRGETFVFVEDLDHRTAKAVISAVPFGPHGPTGPARTVLEEPWHLSYPFVFAHRGEVWMIPESVGNRSVMLYRAERFPDRWVREATLLSDIEASDATLIRHDGLYWMFAATREGGGSWSDSLSIFSAADVTGPWQPHPLNPVLVDQASARPAGAMRLRDGRLWRPVQDCGEGYGTGIGIAEVIRLDREGFEQKVQCVLKADPAWPGRRFHTLNRLGRLEVIDASAYSPRNRWLARRLQDWSGRRDLPDAGNGARAGTEGAMTTT